MTREELIRYGKDYLNDLENAYCEISDKHMEFVRQSIKALSAEPCCNCIEFKRYAKEMGFEIEQEPCEDCISRKDAINAIKRTVTTEQIKELKRLPSVQPKPKTGHWIEYTRVLIPEPINKWEQAWYCSACGYGNQECEDGSAWLEWKYCPNCGAKMLPTDSKKE